MTNFDLNLTSFLGGVMNEMLNVKFITVSGNEVGLTSKFVRNFQLKKVFKLIKGFFDKWIRSSKALQNVIYHVNL